MRISPLLSQQSQIALFLRRRVIVQVAELLLCSSLRHIQLFSDPMDSRFLCAWDLPGKNIGMGSFSRVSFQPRDRTCIFCFSWIDRLFTIDLPGKPLGRGKGRGLLYAKGKFWEGFLISFLSTFPSSLPRKRNAKKQNGCLRRPYK